LLKEAKLVQALGLSGTGFVLSFVKHMDSVALVQGFAAPYHTLGLLFP
jgi:hypothetical protein